MAGETSVLREFLVGLGFKVDEAGLKKFHDGVDGATDAVFRLATAIGGTALTIAIGVDRFANNLEKLYFASQRTGTSATNLKAFARTVEDFGGSAEGALSSIEGLARFIRNNPLGGPAIINSMLAAVGRHYNPNDEAANLESFGLLFAKNTREGRGGANAYISNLLGFDEKTMLAIQNGEFAGRLKTLEDRLKDAGFEKASKDAHLFKMDVRDLGDYLVILGTQVQEALQQKFHVSLHGLVEYIQTHLPEIKQIIMDALDTVIKRVDEVGKVLGWLWDLFKKLDEATDGWAGKIAGLLIVLKAMGATELVTGIISLASAFVRLAAGITSATAAASVGGAAAGGAAGSVGLGAFLAGAARVVPGVSLGVLAGWGLNELAPDNWLAQLGRKMVEHRAGVYEDRERNILNLLDANTGQTHEKNIGILASLIRESNLDPDAVGDNGHAYGLGQWQEPRQRDFQRLFGKSIRGSSAAEQIQFLAWEMQNGTDNLANGTYRALKFGTDDAAGAAEMMDRLYLRPKDIEGAVQQDTDRAIHLTQQTHINIDGSRDVSAVKDAVIEAQRERDSEIQRNVQSLTR